MNKAVVKTPKTDARMRRMPIPHALSTVLLWSRKAAVSKYACPSAEGIMMSETAFQRAWDSYEKFLQNNMDSTLKCNTMPHITPHMLRHTYVTMLYDAGVDVKNAQRYPGHADTSATMEIYTHLSIKKEKIGDNG